MDPCLRVSNPALFPVKLPPPDITEKCERPEQDRLLREPLRFFAMRHYSLRAVTVTRSSFRIFSVTGEPALRGSLR